MANTVTTTFFADGKSAQDALAKLERKYADLENKLKHVSRRSREGSHEAMGALGSLIAKVGGAALAYNAMTRSIEYSIDALRDYRRAVDAAGHAAENANKRLNIATNLGPGANRALGMAAVAAGFPVAQAREAGRDFERFGIPLEAGQTVFEGFMATNAAAKSPLNMQDYLDIISDRLAESGEKATKESVGRVARNLFAMMRGTELAPADFEAAREMLRTEKAGKAGERHRKALHRLGLKPEDVDLTGESLFDALEKLQAGLGKLAPEDRPNVMKELGFTADLTDKLMNGLEVRAKNLGMFDEAVKEITSGEDAATNRAEGVRQLLREAKAGKHRIGDTVNAADLNAEMRDVSPVFRGVGRAWGTVAGEVVGGIPGLPAEAGNAAAGAAFTTATSKTGRGLLSGFLRGLGGPAGAVGMLMEAFSAPSEAAMSPAAQMRAIEQTTNSLSSHQDSEDLKELLRRVNDNLENIDKNTRKKSAREEVGAS